jgi:alpha-ketoglutarate-dependent taurine dioxygenase
MNLFPIVWDEENGIAEVRRRLERDGIALVMARLGDKEGTELRTIVGLLGTAEEHDCLGHAVWHIRYDAAAAARGATASLTMEPLPFHTDGAFEDPSPRYMALYVVREDRYGGGESLLVEVASVLGRLSPDTLDTLRSTQFRFRAPAEYDKGVPYRDAPIVFGDGLVRYRRVIIDERLCPEAKEALDELDAAIGAVEPVRLRMRSGMVLLLDNARFLHARTTVRDPERHLLRMRFSCAAPVVA